MTQRNKIFIYGYHGFRNLGAEARLISMICNLRMRNPDIDITVSTFDKRKLAYIERDHGVKLAYVHPVLHKRRADSLIQNCDIMILAEGNMLTDEFSPLMIEVFTHAMERAHQRGKFVAGVALDSGRISDQRRDRMVNALNSIELLTVRAPSALTELRKLGVQIPIEVTADCALSMPLPSPETINHIEQKLAFGPRRLDAIAPVDFHMWPAKVSLFGRRDEYLRWPIKATWADGGRRMSEHLINDWVRYVDYLLTRDRDTLVPVLVMDPADRRIAQRIASSVIEPKRTVILAGNDLTPLEMSAVMMRFSSVTTSRYHALVLPLPYGVPFIALGHDTRTKFIAEHLDVPETYVWFEASDRIDQLIELHQKIAGSAEAISATKARILSGVDELKLADQRNYDCLSSAIMNNQAVDRAAAGATSVLLEAAR